MTQQQKITMWANDIQETMFAAQILAYQIEVLQLNSITDEMPALKQEVRLLKGNIKLTLANLRNIKNFFKTASPVAGKEIDEELSGEKLKDISLHLSYIKRFENVEDITNLLIESMKPEVQVERVPEATC